MVVMGAAGGLGGAGVPLAKLLGAKVVAVGSRPSKRALVAGTDPQRGRRDDRRPMPILRSCLGSGFEPLSVRRLPMSGRGARRPFDDDLRARWRARRL